MFILLADISISRNDMFQAKATLQRADYYQVEDDGIIDLVKARLSEISAGEMANDTVRMSIGKKQ
ncbi:MAG: hypothetical protein R2744_01960 [Bacteroidales bacterium]